MVTTHVSGIPPLEWQAPRAELSPDLPAEVAIKRVLIGHAEAIEHHRPGVLADGDPEFLHELRIGVRKSRSLIDRFVKVVPELNGWSGELRWLSHVTGELRDLDVYLERFDRYARWIRAGDRPYLEPVRHHILQLRAPAMAHVSSALTSSRYHEWLDRWRRYLAESESSAFRSADLPIGKVARQRFVRTFERTVAEGNAIDDQSPAERLHGLRKSCKKLRYLSELATMLGPDQRADAFIARLKKLQSVLGDHQDLDVHGGKLVGMAHSLYEADRIGPHELLAIGQLRGAMEWRQKRARRRFTERFSKFAGKGNRKRASRMFRYKGS